MYNNIFDTHAHYDARQFNDDRDEMLGSFLPQNGVRAIMTVGDTLASSKRAQALAAKYDYVYFGAGIHPHNAKDAKEDMEDVLRELAADKKLKAIGEIGLDYHYDHSPRDVQKKVFIRQLELAKELDLPVIVHNREAHQDTIEILQEYQPKGIVHSYSGSVETAKLILDIGMYLGFTGVITFKNARVPLEVVSYAPVDRLLLETDCPYLAPVPMRGKRSDSSMIAYTAEKMAELKEMDTQELIDITFNNACEVYKIDKSEI